MTYNLYNIRIIAKLILKNLIFEIITPCFFRMKYFFNFDKSRDAIFK